MNRESGKSNGMRRIRIDGQGRKDRTTSLMTNGGKSGLNIKIQKEDRSNRIVRNGGRIQREMRSGWRSGEKLSQRIRERNGLISGTQTGTQDQSKERHGDSTMMKTTTPSITGMRNGPTIRQQKRELKIIKCND